MHLHHSLVVFLFLHLCYVLFFISLFFFFPTQNHYLLHSVTASNHFLTSFGVSRLQLSSTIHIWGVRVWAKIMQS
ncbi:hypothetical protein MTR67_032107 [Solanum verrucosum]|uniref:Uncharacterized protein n=1 Tax=Solanum verrucosum TaxID=315347 RepID=A0AAF0U3N8_SOLVR|nr:hypothetical protein MTR67_032107 [Solanum verrucosum]